MLCTKYFVVYYFVFAHHMLNNNMGYFIPFELVQQCMKPLGGLKMYVCISDHHKSEPIPSDPKNSRYQMNCIDCVLVQNGSFYGKK